MGIKNIKLNLNRETLVDRIVDILEDRILTGEFLPGTKLSEIGVANEFGVSRVPAREALQRLQEMNLVQKKHNGREVAQFSLEEFREIYELKNVVEAYGAMKGSLKARDSELRKIESVINNMAKCLNSEDFEKIRVLNYQFHDFMVNCSGNRKLIDNYLSLVKQVRWSTTLSLGLPGRPKQSFEEHKAIFEAFKHRKGEEVRLLLETHSNNNMERVLSQLKDKDKDKDNRRKLLSVKEYRPSCP
jgi:DNA-binding GntR family transcriptional regulator